MAYNGEINSPEWWDNFARRCLEKGDMRVDAGEFLSAADLCGNSVLEVGCAFGEFSSYLPEGVQYVGMDISRVLIKEARERHPADVFLRRDFMDLGSGWDKSFDTICAFQVIEHFHPVDEFMIKCQDVARRQLIFGVPRGLPMPADLVNDGHASGWKNEDDLLRDFGRFGTVSFWSGSDHHICGVLSWTC